MQRGNATQQIASIRVAEQAGVDAANLASVLKGRRKPSHGMLIKLKKALGRYGQVKLPWYSSHTAICLSS